MNNQDVLYKQAIVNEKQMRLNANNKKDYDIIIKYRKNFKGGF